MLMTELDAPRITVWIIDDANPNRRTVEIRENLSKSFNAPDVRGIYYKLEEEETLLREIKTHSPDLILVDGNLVHADDGIEFIGKLRCQMEYAGFTWLWSSSP